MASNCTDDVITCWISSQVDVLSNIASNMTPVEHLISGAAYLIGLFFIVKAVSALKSIGESRSSGSTNGTMKEPLIYFLVGAMLLYLPTAVDIMMQSTFGYSNILAYSSISSKSSTLDILFGQNSAVGESLAIIIQVIGLVSFIRGWVLISHSASQGQPPGSMAKGLIHVFGGILAMNIVGTIEIINNTLYGTG